MIWKRLFAADARQPQAAEPAAPAPGFDMNFAVITYDSLRYDTALMANTPNMKQLFGGDNWHKVYTHGTFTLPAHIAIFHAGFLPLCKDENEVGPYNRQKQILFRPALQWLRNKPSVYPTPEAPNIVKGFSKLGYRTVGVGGVHWFNLDFESSRFWKGNYFDEFYWQEEFSEDHPDAFERQIQFIENLLPKQEQKDQHLFLFLNVASTHTPYRNLGKTQQAQVQCLEYVDLHLPRLLSLLPRPLHLIMLGDHGECFGEDGLWGHSFYHPKVMEVPMISLILK